MGNNFKKWLKHSKTMECCNKDPNAKKAVLKRKLRSLQFLCHIEKKRKRVNKIVGEAFNPRKKMS